MRFEHIIINIADGLYRVKAWFFMSDYNQIYDPKTNIIRVHTYWEYLDPSPRNYWQKSPVSERNIFVIPSNQFCHSGLWYRLFWNHKNAILFLSQVRVSLCSPAHNSGWVKRSNFIWRISQTQIRNDGWRYPNVASMHYFLVSIFPQVRIGRSEYKFW